MSSLYSYMYALALLGSLANPLLCLAHHNHVALFVFGDSLFDPGNNNYINTTTDFQANFWPYGHSFFKYPTGRFSDGRLVPDFIGKLPFFFDWLIEVLTNYIYVWLQAEFAKLPLIPGYFQAEEQRRYVNGVNFASDGAGSLVQTHSGFVIDFKTQVQYFKNVIKQLKGMLGDKESNKLLSSAVYMFSNAGNDYLSPFSTNSTIFNSYTKEEYVDMVIDSFINVIKEVYKEGGRKFVIFSAVPLACVPYSRALNFQQTNRTGCEKKFRVLTEIHNKVLPKKLIELEKALQGFKYSYFDLFQAITDIIDRPSRYGFKEAKTACCGSGPYRGLASCGGKRGQLKEYELCKDVRDYMFFDNFHPTEKSNLHFATLLWNGDPNVVRSYSVKSLFEQVL